MENEEKVEIDPKIKIEHLISWITNLSSSQKLLTQVALDFQALAFAKKHQIKESIDQAAEIGKILNTMIEHLQEITCDSIDHIW